MACALLLSERGRRQEKATNANGNVNIHLLLRNARTAWNWTRVRRYAPVFTGKRVNRPPALFFATTPIEQDWVTVRNPEPIPTG
jgi:hypothetical protein